MCSDGCGACEWEVAGRLAMLEEKQAIRQRSDVDQSIILRGQLLLSFVRFPSRVRIPARAIAPLRAEDAQAAAFRRAPAGRGVVDSGEPARVAVRPAAALRAVVVAVACEGVADVVARELGPLPAYRQCMRQQEWL